MKTHTNQLFSDEDFARAKAEGLVRERTHPESPELFILNYTEKAAYDRVWNNVTLNCRGLIVDAFNWIVARPFPKFFNYGQPGCPEIDLDELAVVSDKLDGSLGILYRNPVTGKYAIATRGSFESEQAIHATKIFNTKYADYVPPSGITMLFEIVYPENRIVCNYGDMDDLVFIGSVDIASGDNWDADQDWNWPGPKAEIFPFKTMREALEFPPRAGKEGFVVHFLLSGHRVKIKQEDYIQLHRIVTGLNARSVWQAMVDHNLEDFVHAVPDEFYDFVMDVVADIDGQVNDAILNTFRDYKSILHWLGENPTKKDFAMIAKNKENSWALFALWDNKDIGKEFLRRAKPAHNYSPVKVNNDAD